MKRQMIAAISAAVMAVGVLAGIISGTGAASAACSGSGKDDVTGGVCKRGSGPGSVSPISTRDQQRVWIEHYTVIDKTGDEHNRMRATFKNPNE